MERKVYVNVNTNYFFTKYEYKKLLYPLFYTEERTLVLVYSVSKSKSLSKYI